MGDSVVALPAIHCIHEHFPDAAFGLLTNAPARPGLVSAVEIFQGTGLFQKFHTYDAVYPLLSLGRLRAFLQLRRELMEQRYQLVINLCPSSRSFRIALPSILFFRLCGISAAIGFRSNLVDPYKQVREAPGFSAPVYRMLLARLASLGFSVPSSGKENFSLNLTAAEMNRAKIVLDSFEIPDGNLVIALTPSSNMPSKIWPIEYYQELLAVLDDKLSIWPIIIGGPEDARVGEKLITHLGRGSIAASRLTVRESAALISFCNLYIGNDTGVMHMAVAMGVPCCALFSSRDLPGKWDPPGTLNVVHRKQVSCGGCMLTHCHRENLRCLNSILPSEVARSIFAMISDPRFGWRSEGHSAS